VAVTRRTAADAEVEETLRKVARVAPRRPTAVLRLAPRGWTELNGAPAEHPPGAVLAVTSIAEPALFRRLVEESSGGAAVELLAFPDHHVFDVDDAGRIRRAAGARVVVVTEKDAVKLEGLADLLPPVRVLALAVHAERGEHELDDALRRTTRREPR
jgi:tetraacyldisaccharide-1-P 4'-kinase